MAKKSKLLGNPVNHPAHYTKHESGVEAIEICGRMSFNLGNAFKYVFRFENKWSPIEDLKKARWYINREYFQRTGKGTTDTKGLQDFWSEDIENVRRNLPIISKVIGTTPGDVEKTLAYLWFADQNGGLVSDLERAAKYLGRIIRKRSKDAKAKV
jgi:hypothetical protein